MGQIRDITKIKRLADEFGNPLLRAELIGNGISFVYKVGDGTVNHYHGDLSKGIDDEIAWMERLLTIEP